ncbi:LuxR family transcriptional regulator [Kitasatospora atroaurantiaca]
MLWAACDASEADLSFGMVGQLAALAPAVDVEQLPLLRGLTGADRAPFRVGAQLLELLGELQAGGSVAIVVDDVPWADSASLQALGFVLRRLWADRVLIILTARTVQQPGEGGSEEWRRLMAGRVRARRLLLSGLSAAEVAELAERMAPSGAPSVSPSAVERLWRHTAGHPLYVQTILAELPVGSESGLPDPLPVPPSLADGIERSVAALPQDSRDLLEALAVLDTRSPLRLAGDLVKIVDPAGALEPLLAAGLVRWWPAEPTSPVGMRHPLQRQAVYEALAPQRRRDLHAAAAALVDRAASWRHRVAAAAHADDELAAELEAASGEHLDAGDPARAATLLLWAADLSEQRDAQERRLLTAAAQLMGSSQIVRVQPLLGRAEACAPSPLRSLVLGSYAVSRDELATGRAQLSSAVQEGRGAPDTAWIAAMAGIVLSVADTWLGDFEHAVRSARDVLDLAADDAYVAPRATAALMAAMAGLAGPRAALRELARVARLPDTPAEVVPEHAILLRWRGVYRTVAGDHATGADDLAATLRLERTGDFQDEYTYAALGMAQYLLGRWDEVTINAEHAITAAAVGDKPWGLVLAHTIASLVPSGRGEWQRAEEHVRAAEHWSAALGLSAYAVWPAIAAATLAQARADHRVLIDRLEAVLREPTALLSIHEGSWRPLHIEALLATGRLEEAAASLRALQAFAEDAGYLQVAIAWLSGRLAQQHGDLSSAQTCYEEGLSRPVTVDDAPLHRAFLEHAYGRLLAQHLRDRKGAGEKLRSAHARFAALGAQPFQQRCVADLAAYGLHTPEAGKDKLETLTDRERTIAHLVARGLTNQETAAEIYLSSKTVEFHLSRIFVKLGITSRRQLRDLVGDTSR